MLGWSLWGPFNSHKWHSVHIICVITMIEMSSIEIFLWHFSRCEFNSMILFAIQCWAGNKFEIYLHWIYNLMHGISFLLWSSWSVIGASGNLQSPNAISILYVQIMRRCVCMCVCVGMINYRVLIIFNSR